MTNPSYDLALREQRRLEQREHTSRRRGVRQPGDSLQGGGDAPGDAGSQLVFLGLRTWLDGAARFTRSTAARGTALARLGHDVLAPCAARRKDPRVSEASGRGFLVPLRRGDGRGARRSGTQRRGIAIPRRRDTTPRRGVAIPRRRRTSPRRWQRASLVENRGSAGESRVAASWRSGSATWRRDARRWSPVSATWSRDAAPGSDAPGAEEPPRYTRTAHRATPPASIGERRPGHPKKDPTPPCRGQSAVRGRIRT